MSTSFESKLNKALLAYNERRLTDLDDDWRSWEPSDKSIRRLERFAGAKLLGDLGRGQEGTVYSLSNGLVMKVCNGPSNPSAPQWYKVVQLGGLDGVVKIHKHGLVKVNSPHGLQDEEVLILDPVTPVLFGEGECAPGYEPLLALIDAARQGQWARALSDQKYGRFIERYKHVSDTLGGITPDQIGIDPHGELVIFDFN